MKNGSKIYPLIFIYDSWFSIKPSNLETGRNTVLNKFFWTESPPSVRSRKGDFLFSLFLQEERECARICKEALWGCLCPFCISWSFLRETSRPPAFIKEALSIIFRKARLSENPCAAGSKLKKCRPGYSSGRFVPEEFFRERLVSLYSGFSKLRARMSKNYIIYCNYI